MDGGHAGKRTHFQSTDGLIAFGIFHRGKGILFRTHSGDIQFRTGELDRSLRILFYHPVNIHTCHTEYQTRGATADGMVILPHVDLFQTGKSCKVAITGSVDILFCGNGTAAIFVGNQRSSDFSVFR